MLIIQGVMNVGGQGVYGESLLNIAVDVKLLLKVKPVTNNLR